MGRRAPEGEDDMQNGNQGARLEGQEHRAGRGRTRAKRLRNGQGQLRGARSVEP